jgi:hypothetical protein
MIAKFNDYFGSSGPDVYLVDDFQRPRRAGFRTGVPAFLGLVSSHQAQPAMLTLWEHFEQHVAKPTQDCYLAYAVRGFFENGGRICYVVPLNSTSPGSLAAGLERLDQLRTIDLVCFPDAVRDRSQTLELQQTLVEYCQDRNDRFAILDARRGDNLEAVWDQWSNIDGYNGALYYPWITVPGLKEGKITVPPCGHIAGVYARTDHARGVHKAPANEVLEGVLDLEVHLTNKDSGELNSHRVNALRSFPGRGIRVWGARTLAGDIHWVYVNVRRFLITAIRWIEWHMQDFAFEPANRELWARIERELRIYFLEQYRAGALRGDTPSEAFYVKCNEETNRQEDSRPNEVVVEIGLAQTNPYEFVVVRLIHGERGVRIVEPAIPAQIL